MNSPATVYVFIGDSVTDSNRTTSPGSETGLGDGYVRALAGSEQLAGQTVVNRGVNGNRATDLLARWQQDVLDHDPDIVSILIGVNDMWRRYDSDDPVTVADFAATYRALLDATVAPGRRVILVEPFLLPVRDEQKTWREDLDPKIEAVRALAQEYGLTLVPADRHLTALAETAGPEAIADDGIHPTPRGHEALAALWLEHAAR
ncbi:SGNH/GDSL hydrolase family protein [Compostimonas suwonensis]|uniref:Lysophospholipase L1-like esterase n=1 Tax=Compostimonas suwonensis TaxID=1048394 RepID=A0A2M9C403_9MICO|nr:SGNH/GDSL hydrolase family protein [Compostimonas suwonensis]PJJ65254.1 lysophospholipase L1-like esterase [Compostimonas suwonensis]